MSLTYIGEDEFTQAGPPQWQQSLWDLDTLIIPFSGPEEKLDAYLDSLEKNSAAAIDDAMFLTDWRISGSKVYPQVDLVYIGRKNGELPPQRRDFNDAVMSASSSRTNDGVTLTSPFSIEYYAPTSTLSYISADAPGTTLASPPSSDPRIIDFTVGDTTLSVSDITQALINRLFMVGIRQTLKSSEIVTDKYWKNEATTTKIMTPWIFDLTAGAYIFLASPGNNYAVGDTLRISAGGEYATIEVDLVGGILGGEGILTFHETANTFTAAHNLLPASGGHGTGAMFNVMVIA